MQPKLTVFRSGDAEYTLGESGPTTFADRYAPSKDEWGVDFEKFPPGERSFIPCPFCSGTSVFTFRWSQWVGTNTSGGTDTIVYEVSCATCSVYSLFRREDVSYPYD